MNKTLTVVLVALLWMEGCGSFENGSIESFEVQELDSTLAASERAQLLVNNDFELGPSGWGPGSGGGLTSLRFFTAPWGPYSGANMGRAQAYSDDSTGTMWVWSATVNVAGQVDVRGSIFVRSNMKNIHISVRQRDASHRQIAVNDSAHLTPPGWRWDELKYKVGLLPNCVEVFVVVVADVATSGNQYLDLDHASLYANRTRFGVHSALGWGTVHGMENHVAKIAQLGARISRTTAPWHLIEPADGVYQWSTMDAAVDNLFAKGIQPLIVLHGSPQWANGSTNPEHVPPGSGMDFWVWRWHYGQFVYDMVKRYKGKVRYWEVGNEPNILDFWHPKPDIWQYCTWADYMYDQIKAADPTATVALAGLTILNHGYFDGHISGKDFVRGMLNWNNGALRSKMKIIGLHPYSTNYSEDPYANPGVWGTNRFRDIETIHAIVPNSRIWITEFGWQVGASSGGVVMTEALQQQYLGLASTVVNGWGYVDMCLWFWDWDRPNASFDGYGLVRVDGSLRPAGILFRDWLGR